PRPAAGQDQDLVAFAGVGSRALRRQPLHLPPPLRRGLVTPRHPPRAPALEARAEAQGDAQDRLAEAPPGGQYMKPGRMPGHLELPRVQRGEGDDRRATPHAHSGLSGVGRPAGKPLGHRSPIRSGMLSVVPRSRGWDGCPQPRLSRASAAATRARPGSSALVMMLTSVMTAASVCCRARSRTWPSSFGRPPGLPDWPGFQEPRVRARFFGERVVVILILLWSSQRPGAGADARPVVPRVELEAYPRGGRPRWCRAIPRSHERAGWRPVARLRTHRPRARSCTPGPPTQEP